MASNAPFRRSRRAPAPLPANGQWPFGMGHWVAPPIPSAQPRRGAAIVTEADMMSVPALWAALRTLSGIVAGMEPIDCDDQSKLQEGPREFFKYPTPDLTWFQAVDGAVNNVAVHGNAYWPIVDIDGFGRITKVQPVHPLTVSPRRQPGGYSLSYDIASRQFYPEDLIHFRGVMIGGYDVGVSPLKYLARMIAIQISEGELAKNTFDDGGRPTAGYWTAPGPMEQTALNVVAENIGQSTAVGRGAGVLAWPAASSTSRRASQWPSWSCSQAASGARPRPPW